ncbi:MAG: hypothetical protein ACYDGN_08280 [Acidimicrobiales bacterium]
MTPIESERATGLESSLSELDAAALAFSQALAVATKAAKRARAVAEQGAVRDIASALAAASAAGDAVVAAAEKMRHGWRFDTEDWFASGEYSKELMALAAEQGVSAFESDERILCYPTIVQVSVGDTSVLIDKKKERGVRPSVVVEHLRKLQEREPRFKAETFIESLAVAYDYVVAAKHMRPGAPARLLDVYSVLTVMPGAAREYTKPEFARDVYLLDLSGVVETKKRRQMSLPASALTRSASAVLRTVTKSGQAKDYAGISFDGGPT